MVKIFPSSPTRCCRKITGPAESSLIAMAITAITGAVRIKARIDPMTEIARLQTFCSRERRKAGEKTSQLGRNVSRAILPVMIS